MYSNVDYVMDFTNFSEYDAYVEANFASGKTAFMQENFRIQKGDSKDRVAMAQAAWDQLTPEEKHKWEVKGSGYRFNNPSTTSATEYFDKKMEKLTKRIKRAQKNGNKSALANAQDELMKLEAEANGATQKSDERKQRREGTSVGSNSSSSSGFRLIPKSTGGKVAAGAGAAALATLGTMAVAGSKGIGPMATDNAKIARANRLIAKGQIDKANKILDSVKDKSKLVQPQAYAASEAE